MTKKASVFLVSIWLLIALSKQADFDYVQMVLEWQPAMCNLGKSCKIEPKNKFSIHGVWPSLYSRGQFGPCYGPPFNPDKIIALQDRMNQNWPDLKEGNSLEAWRSKWAIHGTCSAAVFNQFEYFSLGLDTYGRYAMLSILDKGGLAPSSYKHIGKTEFIDVMAEFTSKKGGVICASDHRGRRQVQKVILCYAKDGATLINCPENVSNSCPEYFMWLGLDD